MRQLGIVLLGTLLLLPTGCGGQSEEENKSPDKTAKTKTSEKDSAGKTPRQSKKPNAEKTNSNSEEPSASDNPENKPETANPAEDGKLPVEFAAFSFIPRDAMALLSVRPAAVLGDSLLKSLKPEHVPVERMLQTVEEQGGIDVREIDRVTVAVWRGEGHLFPGSGFGSLGPEKRPLGRPVREPGFREPPDIEKAPDDKFPRPEPSKIEVPEFKQPDASAPPVPKDAEKELPGTCDVQPDEDFGPPIQRRSGPPGGAGPFGLKLDGVLIVQFQKPIDPQALETKIPLKFSDATHNGTTYRANDLLAYSMPDEKTLILTHPASLPNLLDNQDDQNAAPVVQNAVKKGLDHDLTILARLESLRPLFQGPAVLLDEALPGLAELPNQLESLHGRLDLDEGLKLLLEVEANDEAAPQTIQTAYDQAYGQLGQLIAFTLPEELKSEFGEDLGGDITKLLHTIYSEAKGEADGTRFQFRLQVPASAADLIPKLAERQREIAKSIHRKNNFKEIGLAALHYHDTFGEFPFPNGRSEVPEAERDKLSWRVHLLPYLDQYPLYEQFRLDQPWDSEHNKALLEKMPEVYKLSDEAKPGHTQFVVPAGKGFVGEGAGAIRIRDIIDGTSNTLMGVTVVPEKAVPWTKPGGFEIEPKNASKILGGAPKGFWGLFGDGRVLSLDPNIDAESLKALLTIAGGERISPSDYETGR